MNRPPENDDFIRKLIALKRYEQPDPHVEMRTLAALREQLAHTAPGGAWYARWFEALFAAPAPGFRVVVAVCLLALLALNLHLLNQAPSLAPAPLAQPVAEIAAPPAEALPAVAATNESLDFYRKPVFVFEYPSNRSPVGPVHMGPASVPVRLDY